MAVQIKIESGKSAVTISISTVPDPGSTATAEQGNPGTVTDAHTLGAADAGGGANASTSTGSGPAGSGVLVVGPIVVPDFNAATGAAGGGANASTSTGSGANASTSTGSGANASTSTGSGPTGSDVLVIGPIVFGGATVKNPAATQQIKTVPASEKS
jgi:probable phosphoglycerate mutase